MITEQLLSLLLKYNLIRTYKEIHAKQNHWLKITFSYYNNNPIFKKLIFLSTSKNIFVNKNVLRKKFLRGCITILSTSSGVMSNYSAIVKKEGGFVLCRIYIK